MKGQGASKTLLLLRQGKADNHAVAPECVSPNAAALMKPLSDKGKRNAQRIGSWLAEHDLKPDEMLCSSAERAIVSAEKCVKSMGLGVQELRIDHHLFKADPKQFIKVLSRLSKHTRCVLIVADGAGLDALLNTLLNAMDVNKLKASSLAVLTLAADWSDVNSKGVVKIKQCIHAEALPRQFPYPDSPELRDRPTYYYTQSAVIPYRLKHKHVEVLLITSSRNKHWGIPKGIQEPGLTARNSAAKEALEEGGIEGLVGGESLGEYEYGKWGSVCHVTVFPMRVGHVLNKKEWQESYRQRKWCSVKKARTLLKQQALVSMIDQLVKTVAVK